PLFHGPFCESKRSGSVLILRRFHGGFPRFRPFKPVLWHAQAARRRLETRSFAAPYLRSTTRRAREMRVAVVGTGIAGNAAAWTLSKRYPVTVYDRELRPGGHSHTVSVDYDGSGELALMIYEVRNTFGDVHAYVL